MIKRASAPHGRRSAGCERDVGVRVGGQAEHEMDRGAVHRMEGCGAQEGSQQADCQADCARKQDVREARLHNHTVEPKLASGQQTTVWTA